MHTLQALQRLEIDPALAHGQVAALDQSQAQVAGQEGMFKVGFVGRPGRQQHDARRLAGLHQRLGQPVQALQQHPKRPGQTLHGQLAKGLRELLGHDEPVLEHVAQARRRLRALGHDPPQAVGPARQVERDDVQVHATQRFAALQGAQELGVFEHQGRRQQAFGQQAPRAVQIGQRGVEQARALAHAGFDALPIRGVDQQRQQLQRPHVAGTVLAFTIGAGLVDVVAGAVFLHAPLHTGRFGGELFRRGDAAGRPKPMPCRGHVRAGLARFAQGAAQLVPVPIQRPQSAGQHGLAGRGLQGRQQGGLFGRRHGPVSGP